MTNRKACLFLILGALLTSSAKGAEGPQPPPLSTDPPLEVASELLAPELALVPSPSFEDQLLELVNEVRASCLGYSCSASSCPGGTPKPPMKGEWRIRRAADFHSENMGVRNFHMHCDPDTLTSVSDRMLLFGYTPSGGGENIAAGYPTPQEVMFGNEFASGWMGSSGHCANILGGAREIGTGYYYDSVDQGTPGDPGTGNVRQSGNGQCPATSSNGGPFYRYWTQVFASRTISYPLVIERESFLTSSTSADLYLYSPGGTSPQMRFSDDGETWSSLQPYASSSVWPLPTGDGVKVVYSEFQSSMGTFRSCDRIWLDGSGSTATLVFRDSFECGDDSLGLWDAVAP